METHTAVFAVPMNLSRNVTALKMCNRNCIVHEWNKLIRLNGVFGCHDSGEKIHRRQAACFLTASSPCPRGLELLVLFCSPPASSSESLSPGSEELCSLLREQTHSPGMRKRRCTPASATALNITVPPPHRISSPL